MRLLEMENIRKTFKTPEGGELPVLELASFGLSPEAQVGLRGASGSGKSTLLNLISGILQPDSGSIRLAGEELTRLSESGRDRLRARTIGYVFQTFNLLQGYSCLENVLLGMRFGHGVNRGYALSLLDRVGLADRIHYLPRQLSTGQQQRVAVARAMANRPQLLLADEPTGNLDPANSSAVLTLLREVCRENRATLLLTSHEPEALADLDEVRELKPPELRAGMENA